MTGAPFPRGLLEEGTRAKRMTNEDEADGLYTEGKSEVDHLETYFHNFQQRETAVAIVPGNGELQ